MLTAPRGRGDAECQRNSKNFFLSLERYGRLYNIELEAVQVC